MFFVYIMFYSIVLSFLWIILVIVLIVFFSNVLVYRLGGDLIDVFIVYF